MNLNQIKSGKQEKQRVSKVKQYEIVKKDGFEDFVIDPFETYQSKGDVLKFGVDLSQHITPLMDKEYKKIKRDILYFMLNYVKIENLDIGFKTAFDCRDYQKAFLKKIYSKNVKNHILLWSRQTGKSVTTSAWIVYELVTKRLSGADFFKSIITAHLEETAIDYLDRVKEMISSLPFWLQYLAFKGVRYWSKQEIVFGDGSKIQAFAATEAIRGRAAHVAVCDEASFINWEQHDFKSVIFPTTATASNSRVLLMSTPNGKHGVGKYFYERWVDSQKMFNRDWIGQKVLWSVVKRSIPNEEYKRQKIAEVGLDKFKVEYDLEFDGGESSLLIDQKVLKKLKPKKMLAEEFGLKIYQGWKEGHKYIATCDIADGVGGESDFSVVNVFDITNLKKVEQVAIFRRNDYEVGMFWEIIQDITNMYGCRCIIERNNMGASVILQVFNNDRHCLIEDYIEDEPVSFNTNKISKREACSAMKTMIEDGTISIFDDACIEELNTFVGKKGKEGISYSADGGNNDDCVTTLFILAWFLRYKTDMFKNCNMFKPTQQEIEDFDEPLMPFSSLELVDFDACTRPGYDDYWEENTRMHSNNRTLFRM